MSLKSGASRGPRPLTRWHCAHSALALRTASRPRAASPTRTDGRGGIEAGADEGDDRRQLVGSQHERRHAGAGHARRDDAREILVGRRAAEAAELQIDARYAVAVGAVADLALRPVEPLARFDVGAAVLTMILIKHLRIDLNVGW